MNPKDECPKNGTLESIVSDEQKSALEIEREQFEKNATEENGKRSGLGLRVMVGATRGKNTQNIKYEAFDQSKPDTLPTSIASFAEVTSITDEAMLVTLLIDGFNDYQYRQASDPIAEFVNPVWPDEIKLAFRTSVRNYAKAAEVSIEEAANLMKPSIDKKYAQPSA